MAKDHHAERVSQKSKRDGTHRARVLKRIRKMDRNRQLYGIRELMRLRKPPKEERD